MHVFSERGFFNLKNILGFSNKMYFRLFWWCKRLSLWPDSACSNPFSINARAVCTLTLLIDFVIFESVLNNMTAVTTYFQNKIEKQKIRFLLKKKLLLVQQVLLFFLSHLSCGFISYKRLFIKTKKFNNYFDIIIVRML